MQNSLSLPTDYSFSPGAMRQAETIITDDDFRTGEMRNQDSCAEEMLKFVFIYCGGLLTLIASGVAYGWLL